MYFSVEKKKLNWRRCRKRRRHREKERARKKNRLSFSLAAWFVFNSSFRPMWSKIKYENHINTSLLTLFYISIASSSSRNMFSVFVLFGWYLMFYRRSVVVTAAYVNKFEYFYKFFFFHFVAISLPLFHSQYWTKRANITHSS